MESQFHVSTNPALHLFCLLSVVYLVRARGVQQEGNSQSCRVKPKYICWDRSAVCLSWWNTGEVIGALLISTSFGLFFSNVSAVSGRFAYSKYGKRTWTRKIIGKCFLVGGKVQKYALDNAKLSFLNQWGSNRDSVSASNRTTSIF